jgi:hypothetical protein
MKAIVPAKRYCARYLGRTLLLSLIWAALMALSAAGMLGWSRDGVFGNEAWQLTWFFALGGFVAWSVARLFLGLVPDGWSKTQRFAAAFILVGAATVGFTALFFSISFQAYFSQWHDDHLSKRLVFETVFTILSAFYQFLVLGLRLYIPFGLIALTGAAWAFAQRRI